MFYFDLMDFALTIYNKSNMPINSFGKQFLKNAILSTGFEVSPECATQVFGG